ncbi:ribonuclease PH [Mahella australiensis 50-1 BON]|uniref:Ribonuclease PH n=2 Tax=Mahella TaxID=252965 RepID=F4A1Z5_MAHA5|nr:ribonuclease PH [Mahella australiensis]AEE96111.1 ribonuclease PH [Mahella australiensis 50-1 BON]
MRAYHRGFDQLRPVTLTRDYLKHPDGSVLIEAGETKIICTAMIEDKVPPFLKGTGKGWITSEYGMLPGSTQARKIRESTRGHIEGRTQEIQRIIGRTLRSVVDISALGERTIWIDCDVIQADGGTRTASITGSFVALAIAINKLFEKKKIERFPISNLVAAVSVGIVDGQIMLDLCYDEDARAQVDMNIAMTDDGRFVEVQGTGEAAPFSRRQMDELINLADKGIQELMALQIDCLGEIADKIGGRK